MALRGIFRRLSGTKAATPQKRTALVVVDDSEELGAAIEFTARRAAQTDMDIVLLRINEPLDGQNWMFVGDLIAQEARDDAINKLHVQAGHVREITGQQPQLYMREGNAVEELKRFVAGNPAVRILVLASAPKGGPGPLVEAVTGKLSGKLGIPVIIVPGHVDHDRLQAFS